LLFHRWGGLGNHRYQIGFSGDTVSVWESLAFQPWFTATAANVGYAYWSHDIGGHMPGSVEPELYTRWIQFGAFSPILRTHTTKNPDSERRIWAYPEPYSGIMRDTFHLRYALEPYLYTEARRTYDTGVAFLRPLYYDWPESDASYTNKEEYIFGEAMIVAPVVTPVDKTSQLAQKSIWIPDGEWIEQASGKHFTGPTSIERSFAIDQIPVYKRAGAIIPMQPEMRFTGEKPVDPLIVEVLPLKSQKESTYTLYQDDSKGVGYKRDICAWTKLSARQSGEEMTIDIAPIQGSYPGMPAQRGYELRLPEDWPPSSVTANGIKLQFNRKEGSPGWRYEGNTLTTVITVSRHSVHEKVHIVVHRDNGSLANRTAVDGFTGATARLREAYNTLNALWPFTWSSDALIDAMQTGDRLSYHPERAQEELSRFSKIYTQAIADLQVLIEKTTESDQQLEAKLMQDKGADTAKERAQRYKLFLHRALMQLQDGKPE
jgi:alpha-glucosidase